MPNAITAVLISIAVVLGILAIGMTVRHLQRKRAFSRMVAVPCPACGKAYGSGILSAMKEAGYFWNPAPGHSVISLRLPSSTFLVKCPHCSVETEFDPSGRVFEQPK